MYALNINLEDNDFDKVDKCPWCGMTHKQFEYKSIYNSVVFKCEECGLLYSDKILNDSGLKKYWSNYSVHTNDENKNLQRHEMYRLEYDFIRKFINNGRVLDVGCGEGEFLDLFKKDKFITEGVEFGEEAANIASKNNKIYYGKLPELSLKNKYDLIIFRGVIQYLLKPKQYFDKAISLLNNGGIIFITSSPNCESVCCKLFKENFTLPVTPMDYFMFSEKILDDYFESQCMKKVASKFFYEETPYYDKNDAEKILKALENNNQNIKSPAWYDNMLSIIYKNDL